MGKRKSPKSPDLPVVEPVAPSGPSGGDSDGDSDGLNPRERAFAEAIAAGGGLADGAKAARISYRSAKRWHHKPAIAEAVKARVAATMSQARAVLASGANRSARELIRLAEKAKPDAVRVAACKVVLEQAIKLEVAEMGARIAEIEARLNAETAETDNGAPTSIASMARKVDALDKRIPKRPALAEIDLETMVQRADENLRMLQALQEGERRVESDRQGIDLKFELAKGEPPDDQG